MAAFLGVSRTISFLEKKPGDTNFWCVGGRSGIAKPGDQLLLYFPRSVSPRNAGIGQIYQITSLPQKLNRSPCSNYGMLQVETRLQMTLNKHIKIDDMRANEVIEKWPALRRNMQGVTFTIDDEIWSALRAMIVQNNPQAEAILTPLEAKDAISFNEGKRA